MSKSLNPKNLVERLEGRVPIGPEETRALLENLFDLVAEEVKTSGRMALFGFGSFSTVPVKGRIRLSPRTGEPVVIPEHLRVKFSPASALAERVNKEYEALEPVILEEAVPEGLLVKASRYREDLGEDQEEIFSPEKPKTSPAEPLPSEEPHPVQPEESVEKREPESAEEQTPEKPNGRRRVITAIILLAILLVLFGLFLIVGFLKPVPVEKPVISEEPKVRTAVEQEERKPSTAPQLQPAVTYEITPGDTFSILARRYWGKVDLWPYLYDVNKHRYPDPDYLYPGDRILIPPRPEEDIQQEEIESSILSAYTRYLTLINEEKENPRNRYRLLNVRNLLSGGEALYPDFVKRYQQRINPEDIRRALRPPE